MSLGVFPEFIEKFHRFRIEVALRPGRVGFAFAGQESPDVAAVFLQESPAEILRMSLEMNEQTLLFLFDEEIDAALRRRGEERISARHQGVCSNFIPTGMRETDCGGCPVEERMNAGFFEIEDTELLFGQGATLDGVAVKDAGMCCEAGQNCRCGVAFRPV